MVLGPASLPLLLGSSGLLFSQASFCYNHSTYKKWMSVLFIPWKEWVPGWEMLRGLHSIRTKCIQGNQEGCLWACTEEGPSLWGSQTQSTPGSASHKPMRQGPCHATTRCSTPSSGKWGSCRLHECPGESISLCSRQPCTPGPEAICIFIYLYVPDVLRKWTLTPQCHVIGDESYRFPDFIENTAAQNWCSRS